MAIVRTNQGSYPSFSSLIDDFFNTELGDWKRNNYSSSNTTLPKVNIMEDNDNYMVEMAAPGMSKSDFIIQIDNGALSISSEKSNSGRSSDLKYTKREFAYQAFARTFNLPDTANSEKISASYKNGILLISIPKKEESKPKPARTISVS